MGPLGVFTAMSEANDSALRIWLGILLLCFVLPAVVTILFNEILRKIGWVKTGDMKLENT